MTNISNQDSKFLVSLTFDIASYIKALPNLNLAFYLDDPDRIQHKEIKFYMKTQDVYKNVLAKIKESFDMSGTISFYPIKYTLKDADILIARNSGVEFRLTKISNSRDIPEYNIDYIIGFNNGPKI